MRCSICAIAKMENDYINDWVRYHLHLGFDEIYIYDNNDVDFEPIEDRIDSDILPYVHIFKWPGVINLFQRVAYDNFYKMYSKCYDWCAFIDLDEFITLIDWRNIKEFLAESYFTDTKMIKLGWHNFGDGGHIKQDISIPIYERLTQESFKDKRLFSKCIIRGGLRNKVEWLSSHQPDIDGSKVANGVDGRIIDLTERHNIDKRDESAFIRHFRTKTLDEFINQKFVRKENNGNKGALLYQDDPIIRFKYYFQDNEKTQEKVEYIKEKLGIDV